MPDAKAEPNVPLDVTGAGARATQEAIRTCMGSERRSDALDPIVATMLFTDTLGGVSPGPMAALPARADLILALTAGGRGGS